MITVLRYREITGDNTSAGSAIGARIDEAVELLEDYLDRPLPQAERTEQLRPDRTGTLWPPATPLAEADGYTIDGLALIGTSPFPSFLNEVDTITVTYTGGWADPNADGYDPAGPHQLPAGIARDLAYAVYHLLHPAPVGAPVPANASSVRLGDASITFKGTAGSVTPGDTDSWWSKRTKSYRYSRVDTPAGCTR